MPKERSTRTVADVKRDLMAQGLTKEQRAAAPKQSKEEQISKLQEQIRKLQGEGQNLQMKQAQEPTQGDEGGQDAKATAHREADVQFSSRQDAGQASVTVEESKPAPGQASKPSTQTKR